ncbi:MAG: hypothetical protein QY311_00265 [Candidatus Paceibacterota bacterium]|nr:MAG: hypothetical protein QY311_00265 [Candidatus Paceibacterota bacterium]
MNEYSSIADFRAKAGYEHGGVWYPRVTSILSIKAKPALYAFYGRMPSFAAGKAMTERSAQEGTAVHEAVENILRGKAEEHSPAVLPSVRAFRAFLMAHDVKPLSIEEPVISNEHHYIGTLDVLAEIDGRVGVLDIKTSKGIYREYGMQTAAYIGALKERGTLPDLTSWVIRLDQFKECELCNARMRSKGGMPTVRGGVYTCRHEWSPERGEYEFSELPDTQHNFEAFLAAKKLWEWEHAIFLKELGL